MTLTERTRLAQELHDGIAQDLVGVGYCLDLIMSNQETPVETRQEIRKVRLDITDLLDKIRSEIHDLHEVSEKSFIAQLRDAAEDLCTDYDLTLDLPDEQIFLPDETSYQLMRIVRELLRNIVRHSNATKVGLHLINSGSEITLSINDNGHGGALQNSYSFGLTGSADRARSIGGALTWQSDSTGFAATIHFPISQQLF
ncbi:MAG: hypothetical protein H7227_07820 [Actinobacteria bacterium]|nr:hypothetical protein [Actinomycetota bacterium]